MSSIEVSVAVVSWTLSPKAGSQGAFSMRLSSKGLQPELLTLTFSQVTSWIFVYSLMNAAILGFYYGIWEPGPILLIVALLQIWNYPCMTR